MAVGREDFADRIEQKIERYRKRAAKAEAESLQQHNRASEMSSVIPFGQPILVGHHSEKRHRATARKIEAAHRKGFEESEKAEYYRDRAKTVESNQAISGDNPDAMSLYAEKLAKLEALQERMKAVNAYWRKHKTMKGYPKLSDDEVAKIDAQMESANPWVQKTGPFPDFRLKNNNAEIRRIKAKLKDMEKLDGMEDEVISFPGGELLINTEINRVQFHFDEKPSAEIRSLLKRQGFRWAPSEGAWQRQRTTNAIRDAKWLLDRGGLK